MRAETYAPIIIIIIIVFDAIVRVLPRAQSAPAAVPSARVNLILLRAQLTPRCCYYNNNNVLFVRIEEPGDLHLARDAFNRKRVLCVIIYVNVTRITLTLAVHSGYRLICSFVIHRDNVKFNNFKFFIFINSRTNPGNGHVDMIFYFFFFFF